MSVSVKKVTHNIFLYFTFFCMGSLSQRVKILPLFDVIRTAYVSILGFSLVLWSIVDKRNDKRLLSFWSYGEIGDPTKYSVSARFARAETSKNTHLKWPTATSRMKKDLPLFKIKFLVIKMMLHLIQ